MITPVGLTFKKKRHFNRFQKILNLNSPTFNAERSIVQLLLHESENIFRKIEVKVPKKFNERSPEKLKQRYAELEKKYFDHQRTKTEKKMEKSLRKEIILYIMSRK